MIFRFLIFIIIVILFIIFGFSLVKDLGDCRKKVEKKIKTESAAAVAAEVSSTSQEFWQKGPKHKK